MMLIHQPMGGAYGQATDIRIRTEEILRIRKELNSVLARHTGQPIEQIQIDTERDFYMTAQQAKDYGLIDEVVSDRGKPESSSN
jgi:ATP-dependent Clp protease protease subunit